MPINESNADMAELADAPDLGSGGETREGSSPFTRTNTLKRLAAQTYTNAPMRIFG